MRPRTGLGSKRSATPATTYAIPVELPQVRERDAGGPDDRALYHCHCGYMFEAAVTTSVGCPHCGSAQAW